MQLWLQFNELRCQVVSLVSLTQIKIMLMNERERETERERQSELVCRHWEITAKDDGNVLFRPPLFILPNERATATRLRLTVTLPLPRPLPLLRPLPRPRPQPQPLPLLLLLLRRLSLISQSRFSHISALPSISAKCFPLPLLCLIFVFHFSFCTALIL